MDDRDADRRGPKIRIRHRRICIFPRCSTDHFVDLSATSATGAIPIVSIAPLTIASGMPTTPGSSFCASEMSFSDPGSFARALAI